MIIIQFDKSGAKTRPRTAKQGSELSAQRSELECEFRLFEHVIMKDNHSEPEEPSISAKQLLGKKTVGLTRCR